MVTDDFDRDNAIAEMERITEAFRVNVVDRSEKFTQIAIIWYFLPASQNC
jgi:hypothetical protein